MNSTDLLVIGAQEVEAALSGREQSVIDAVRKAYEAHAQGATSLPHSSFLRFPDSDKDRIISLPAYLGGEYQLAGVKWVASMPDNITHGTERASAVIILNDRDTGRPRTVMEGSIVSKQRTAASAALASRVLAHREPDAIGFWGCGPINTAVAQFLSVTWPNVRRFMAYDLDPARAEVFGEGVCAQLPAARCITTPTIDALLRECPMVAFATTAIKPHVKNLDACPPDAILLHVSLRDLSAGAILSNHNIVDDLDHVNRAATSINLAANREGNTDFVYSSLGDILLGGVNRPVRDGRKVIFSPFGLGVLDLAVADLVFNAIAAGGGGAVIKSFLPERKDRISMSVVWSCNEWDPLEEVIVGNPLRARFPTADRSTQLAEFPDRPLKDIPQGPFPQWIIDETEEDLNAFVAVLEGLGITVRRPDTWPHAERFSTVHWESGGYYNYCPRDIMLVIGDRIIETPNVIRSRAQESFSYRSMMVNYLKAGAKWFSAPKPMLLDSLFEVDLDKPSPRNDEPAFDAANVLRLGRDLIYLVSATGNEMGGQWLQTILGDEYRIHYLKEVYYGSHIDSTFVALRPGLMLCNPARISDDTLPEILKQWQVIYSPPMAATDRFDADYLSRSIGSEWIDMNLFSIRPNLVVVDRDQTALIRLLEKQGIDVIRLKLRHSKMLGGGFHCVTLDIRRAGTLQRYFD